MDGFNIRITHREGDNEHTIEIDSRAPVEISGPDYQLLNGKIGPITTIQTPAQLEWSDTLCKGERINYAAAEKACTALGDGWRLPTRFELESILDLTRSEPAIDVERFPDTKSGYYWSSTPYAASPGYAWIVGFGGGLVGSGPRDSGGAFVRAVRSVPSSQ